MQILVEYLILINNVIKFNYNAKYTNQMSIFFIDFSGSYVWHVTGVGSKAEEKKVMRLETTEDIMIRLNKWLAINVVIIINMETITRENTVDTIRLWYRR
jgi:hypothetical protein